MKVPLAPPALTSAAPFMVDENNGKNEWKLTTLPVFSWQKSIEPNYYNYRQNLLPLIFYTSQ